MGLVNRRRGKYTSEGLAIMQNHWLTYPQVVTLSILQGEGALAVSEIADQLKLSRGAASHLVERLVQKKLVMRSEAAADRRYKRISITARGATLVERLNSSRLKAFSRMFKSLPPELCDQFNGFLEQLILRLEIDHDRAGVAGPPAFFGRRK